MAKFFCKNCGYKFEADTPKKCPYCNEEALKRERSAEEMINEMEE